MRDGWIKVGCISPKIQVGDVSFNTEQIIAGLRDAEKQGVKLAVFPELCLTGYTCGDLFLQKLLLDGALDGLRQILAASQDLDLLAAVGLPFCLRGNLYNVAAVFFKGKLLGLVPKTHIPNYSEFYEARHFSRPQEKTEVVQIPLLGDAGKDIPFGAHLLFTAQNLPDFILGVELCEDLWVAEPPSGKLALCGATVIANLSASDEFTGKDIYRKDLVKSQSARLVAAYVYADAGEGESSTDLVFAAHNLIAENGTLLAESKRFQTGMTVSEVDLMHLDAERRRISTFSALSPKEEGFVTVPFSFAEIGETKLTRHFSTTPFVPQEVKDRDRRCSEILTIQAMGLKKRLAHTKSESAVIGISGGLDSTLALLVTVRAFDLLKLDRKKILAVTMPCFGTTDRTYQNACRLAKSLGVTLKEVPIAEAVNIHFRDIGQDSDVHDVTYENAQARSRTLVLMDLANQTGGLVVGTGDMSELALGWATYNGDHMSMYGVNCSVPKTLVRYLVSYCAKVTKDETLSQTLTDVLDTPVSPELLPPENGTISQKTEDIVGPYELHDFFLYYLMRFGFPPKKICRMAVIAFAGTYDKAEIVFWLKTFYRRFFAQQFKRSCLPDGPKVGSVALSPRGDWRMPSDAAATLWEQELAKLF